MLRQKEEMKVHADIKDIRKYSLLAIITMFSLASFTFSDILLVKHFFSLSDAGLYAGLSLVGKIILYFSSPITIVMFPILMSRLHKGENMQGTLFLSIILVFIPSLFLAVLYAALPQFFISLFLGGNSYLRVSNYLSLYGIYIAIFSVINILANYFLTIQRENMLFAISIAAVTQIAGIIFFHSNFFQVIAVCISVVFLLCIFLTLDLIRQIKKT